MNFGVLLMASSILLSSNAFAETAETRSAEKQARQVKEEARAQFSKMFSSLNESGHEIKIKSLTTAIEKRTEAIEKLNSNIEYYQGEANKAAAGDLGAYSKAEYSLMIQKLEEQRLKLLNDAANDRMQIENHQEAIKNLANLNPKSIEVGLAKIEAAQLLVESDNLNQLLTRAGVKIDQIYGQLNRSLIGDYSAYVASQAIEKFNSNGKLCEAVEKCEAVQANSKGVEILKGQIQPFEEWKKSLIEAAKPATN